MIAALALALATPAQADGWISYPADTAAAPPVVLHFRRTLELPRVPRSMPVTITADNRYVLFVNGSRIAAGPSTGDIAHWRTAVVDLAPLLRRGRNVVAAVVWNYFRPSPDETLSTQTAPAAQLSVATGFRLQGGPLDTGLPGWRVKVDTGRSARNVYSQLRNEGFYVAGAAETIDAARTDWDWAGAKEIGGNWENAAPAPAAARRTLVADRLPPQSYRLVPSGTVVRSDIGRASAFPRHPVTIPPHSRATLLVRRDAMISAYPELSVARGRDARIDITYAEALHDQNFKKGDRDEIGERQISGLTDTFLADGSRRTFAPLWWRTWRFVQIAVTTGAEPLRLEGFRTFETGYPFAQLGRFRSSDPALDQIWRIGWRTARIDAHETYMDTAYWEQLQYAGDTRLQMLISYAVSGDARLAEQGIDAFAASDADDGLVQGAYPSYRDNVIAPFTPMWVGMLHDWWMQQPDTAPVVRNLPRMRRALAWIGRWRTPGGLLGHNPQWNFIDWADGAKQNFGAFPPFSRSGESCLTSVAWLGALRHGAALEQALGDPTQARADADAAAAMAAAIRTRCWMPARGLFADNPDGDRFSQHMNALAVLYDVASPSEARDILEGIVVPGQGIDAPAGITTTTYYFAWYLVRAFEHAGMADRYLGLLDTWRGLLRLHYTTWPELRGDTRSDTHAWSAHPTADLLGIVAGIGPAAPGYARLRVAPAIGDLTSLDATAATPKGPVSVRYRRSRKGLSVTIIRPAALPGEFVWRDRVYPLEGPRTVLRLGMSATPSKADAGAIRPMR